MLAYCDNTDEPLAGMMRRGSAGSNTTADHLQLLDDAIAALPPKYRRRLMVTADGAGASHGLITRLDKLAARPGHQLIYSVGWELGARERTAITAVPAHAWQIAIDHRGEVRERRADDACAERCCAHPRCWIEEAHVTELTGLLREGPGRGPAGRLAREHAGLRPPRAAAPRRPADPVRSRRRLALLPVGIERARQPARLARPAGLHRRRAQGSRQGRGPDPHRERLRHRPVSFL